MEGPNNMRDQHDGFDRAWQEAFEGASMKPPEEVWLKLDAHLANQAAAQSRKSISLYRWVAAAAVAITLLFGGVVLYQNMLLNNQTAEAELAAKYTRRGDHSIAYRSGGAIEAPEQQGPAGQDPTKQPNLLAQQGQAEPAEGTLNDKTPLLAQQPSQVRPAAAANQTANQGALANNASQGQNANGVTQHPGIPQGHTSNPGQPAVQHLPLINDQPQPLVSDELNHEVIALLPVQPRSDWQPRPELHEIMVEFWAVPVLPQEWLVKNTAPKDRYWAGVTFGGGSYLPDAGAPFSSNDEAFFQPTGLVNEFADANRGSETIYVENPGVRVLTSQADVDNLQSSPAIPAGFNNGQTFSMGVNGGMRMGQRFTLSGGVQYTRNEAPSQTGAFAEEGSGLVPLNQNNVSTEANRPNTVVRSAGRAIDLTNSYEYLTVPLQLGYAFINKPNWQVSVNTGVVTDVFMKYQVQDAEGAFNTSVLNLGSDDLPFQPVLLSGMLGVGLNYNITQRYSFSLEPSFRMAVTDFTSNSVNYDSRPGLFNVAVGFRYNFK